MSCPPVVSRPLSSPSNGSPFASVSAISPSVPVELKVTTLPGLSAAPIGIAELVRVFRRFRRTSGVSEKSTSWSFASPGTPGVAALFCNPAVSS